MADAQVRFSIYFHSIIVYFHSIISPLFSTDLDRFGAANALNCKLPVVVRLILVYFGWLMHSLNGHILRIGRLQHIAGTYNAPFAGTFYVDDLYASNSYRDDAWMCRSAKTDAFAKSTATSRRGGFRWSPQIPAWSSMRKACSPRRVLKTRRPPCPRVSFRWRNPDFLLMNPDFLLKNGLFITKTEDENAAITWSSEHSVSDGVVMVSDK